MDYDEELNVRLTKLAYALAERRILEEVFAVAKKAAAHDENFDRYFTVEWSIQQLLEESFEEALAGIPD